MKASLFGALALCAAVSAAWFATRPTALERDAARAAFLKVARAKCGEVAGGSLDVLFGRYDFHPVTSEDFDRAMAQSEHALQETLRRMSQRQVADFCKCAAETGASCLDKGRKW